MFTSPDSSTPLPVGRPELQAPSPLLSAGTPTVQAPSTPLSAGTPTVQGPALAGQGTSAAPLSGQSQRDADATCTAAFQAAGPASTTDGAAPPPPLALWERVDATWPVIANSPTGLDGDAQRLVRHLLTRMAGQRLSRRRQSDAAAWMWEPDPQMADYVRRWRFYAPGLYRFQPPDLYDLLYTEARLALEVVTTLPGVLTLEVWQELLQLQCRRIGQLYAALQRCLGSAQAQAALQRLLEKAAC